MKLSEFGAKLTGTSGIQSLMDDLGHALAEGHDLIMMGGGNPAHIPEVEDAFKERLQCILDSPELFRRLIGTYDQPQGDKYFIRELAATLKRKLGWPISEHNIALTNGSQSAFFMLFNMFGGRSKEGGYRKIQLPMTPEYIGYADTGIEPDLFSATRPAIEHLDDTLFKYRIDFKGLNVTDKTAALCVSRPTNPTGNVITDDELAHLDDLAKAHDIPLIIDGAYGQPFPNLLHTDATPFWNTNTILCLSLSKLGLPAARTGIVIASEEVIQAIAGINAIISLAPNSFGSMLAMDMVRDGSIMELSQQLIRPFYYNRAQAATEYLSKKLGDLPFYIHKPEGAMFLWLWFKDLPISSLELYHRLKRQGVLVVSGHYFFPGLEQPWSHQNQCIRVTYTQDRSRVEKGLDIIAQEVRKAYGQE